MTAFPEPTGGAIDGAVHRYALRVYYEDTDAGGVVYHANYLRWFERARSDMLRLLGIDQRGALDAGEGGYAIADLAIRYLAPARLGDAVLVETRVKTVQASSCVLQQTVSRDHIQLSEATVRAGFVGPDGRPKRQPRAWREQLAALATHPKGQETI
ncbi:MAG: YbgC/FadM family acyl-CoA thioesterase [Novosphingobium sp.]|nr:YbgC/FadM family acyl-CoA thioesterase [Novosphingobium sp.]